MKHNNTKPVAAGTALLAALALSPAASAATFTATNMPSGYMVVADASMGNGMNSMGTPMKSNHEANCSANKAKRMRSTKKMDKSANGKKMMHTKGMKEAGCSSHKGSM